MRLILCGSWLLTRASRLNRKPRRIVNVEVRAWQPAKTRLSALCLQHAGKPETEVELILFATEKFVPIADFITPG